MDGPSGRGPGPGTGLPWNSCSAEGLSAPPRVQKRGSGWLAASKGPGGCRSEREAMAGPRADPSIFPSCGSPLLSAMGPRDPGSNSLPLQRRPATAPLCTGSPPGGERTMGAPCPRTGARTSPARVSPGGQPGPGVPSWPWGRAGGVGGGVAELTVPPVVLSPRPSRPRAAQGPGSAGRRSHGDAGRLPGPLGASGLLLPAGTQLLRDPHQGGAPTAAPRGASARGAHQGGGARRGRGGPRAEPRLLHHRV